LDSGSTRSSEDYRNEPVVRNDRVNWDLVQKVTREVLTPFLLYMGRKVGVPLAVCVALAAAVSTQGPK
jgi:hypothetical protein